METTPRERAIAYSNEARRLEREITDASTKLFELPEGVRNQVTQEWSAYDTYLKEKKDICQGAVMFWLAVDEHEKQEES